MDEYKHHTVKQTVNAITIIATQKYTTLSNGQEYYVGGFVYVITSRQHIMSTGSIMCSGLNKITTLDTQKLLDQWRQEQPDAPSR